MTNVPMMLDHLNKLRAARDMKPLKAWKASKEKLREAIASLEVDSMIEEDKKVPCKAPSANPDRVRAAAETVAAEMRAQGINIVVAKEPMKYVTLVEIAKELGISPKVARAKMRRVFRSSGDTTFAEHTYPEVLKERIITILKRDLRKK